MDGSPDRHEAQHGWGNRAPPRPAHLPSVPDLDPSSQLPDEWYPEPGPGRIVGLAIAGTAGLVGLALLLLSLTVDGPVRVLWLLGAIIAFGLCAAATLGLRRLDSMRYRLTPGSLIVAGAGEPVHVPYGLIFEIAYEPGDRIGRTGYERFWPGFYLSRIRVHGEHWRSVATVPPARRVRLRLRDGTTLAISPQRPILFANALARRVEAAPVVQVPAAARQTTDQLPAEPATPERRGAAGVDARPGVPPLGSRPSAATVFRDLIVRGDRATSDALAASLIGLIALLFITIWKSDTVSTPIAIHWNARGEPERFVQPDGLWIFDGVWIYVLSAVAVLTVNTSLATLAAWRGDRLLARILLRAVPPIEIILLVALWRASSP